MTANLTKFIYVPPIPPPPPPAPTPCYRIATNQIGQEGFLAEPAAVINQDVWVGADSGATGIHQAYRYEDWAANPPPALKQYGSASSDGVTVVTVPGMLVAQGDTIVAFATIIGGTTHSQWFWVPPTQVLTEQEARVDAINGNAMFSGALLTATAGFGDVTLIHTGDRAMMSVFVLGPAWPVVDASSKSLVTSDATPTLAHTTASDYAALLAAVHCQEVGSPTMVATGMVEKMNDVVVDGADTHMMVSGFVVPPAAGAKNVGAAITGYTAGRSLLAGVSVRGWPSPEQQVQQYLVLKDVQGTGFYDGEKLELQSV